MVGALAFREKCLMKMQHHRAYSSCREFVQGKRAQAHGFIFSAKKIVVCSLKLLAENVIEKKTE